MNKVEPSVFLQTRSTTCGVACLMMTLEALGLPIKLTQGTEGEIFRELRIRGHDLVPAISLVTYARKQGRLANAVMENGTVNFWDWLRNTNLQMYEAQEEAYAKARATGANISREAVSIDSLRESLGQGNLIIVGVELGGGIKHALLVYEWKDRSFLLVDPLSGKRSVPEDQLLREMEMQFGRWFIEIR